MKLLNTETQNYQCRFVLFLHAGLNINSLKVTGLIYAIIWVCFPFFGDGSLKVKRVTKLLLARRVYFSSSQKHFDRKCLDCWNLRTKAVLARNLTCSPEPYWQYRQKSHHVAT